MLGFALSNGPHLHRAYLVTIPFDLILAVQVSSFEMDDFKVHIVARLQTWLYPKMWPRL